MSSGDEHPNSKRADMCSERRRGKKRRTPRGSKSLGDKEAWDGRLPLSLSEHVLVQHAGRWAKREPYPCQRRKTRRDDSRNVPSLRKNRPHVPIKSEKRRGGRYPEGKPGARIKEKNEFVRKVDPIQPKSIRQGGLLNNFASR